MPRQEEVEITMAPSDVILPTERPHELPVVRTITFADLRDALAKGLDDFWAMPTHVIFLSLIYPIIGIALASATFDYDVVPLLFPLAAGFALIGPFAAIGLYELSRRRELGLDTSWRHAFDIIHSPSIWSIAALGLLLLAIFAVWLAVANAIYVANFGTEAPTTPATFARNVLTTPAGQRLIIIGNAVGFLFAVVAFTLSVVSFPLLLDRHTGAAVAIITSIRAVLANPLPMAAWALFVAGALVIGSLPFLIGLALVMPVLGHSTWHLYRKVVEPDTSPRPEFHPRPKGRRYGADLPVSLFVPSKPEDRI
ncbi:MAG TPA: DUF2189 domain-containing protein [Hyphomicrobiaceae bacterium]|nr:DUF2189 domain-containing protein [Hyphomicrobiaceae bacterium]